MPYRDMLKGIPLPPRVQTTPMRTKFTPRPTPAEPEVADGTDHITVDEPSS